MKASTGGLPAWAVVRLHAAGYAVLFAAFLVAAWSFVADQTVVQPDGAATLQTPRAQATSIPVNVAGVGDPAGIDPGSKEARARGVYSFVVKDVDGAVVGLSQYAGLVSVVVNTASECGYTAENLGGLQRLYEQFHSRGFTVLAFPSNDFQQESLDGAELRRVYRDVYGVTFHIFEKTHVAGPEAHPLFRYISQALPPEYGKGLKPSWNFYKAIVDRNGRPVARLDMPLQEAKLRALIEPLLAQG